jgi:tripartite-type tricarboxylate transporter receptor subunit TctC
MSKQQHDAVINQCRTLIWSKILPVQWVLAGLTLFGIASAVRADPVEDFYKDHTVRMIIGYSVGGGYDLYGRILARHMEKYIPGHPKIVPQNMEGAGSLKAANYLYSIAPKDGSTIGIIGRGLPMEPLLGTAAYDSRKFTWIGSISNETSLCASWATSPVNTWNDIFSKEFIVGGNGSGSDPDVFALLLRDLFGAKIKLITGYPGGSDINLAMERGEIHGRCGWSWSTIESRNGAWLNEHKINLLVQFGLEKNRELSNVPLIMDFATTAEQKQILRLILARQVTGRPVLGPPDIPQDRKQALRQAFDLTMKDPDFLADTKKAHLEVEPIDGAAIDGLIAELYRTPKDTLAKAVRAIQP